MPEKNYARAYTKSSSFQMALFFTLLCGITALILGYFGYYFNRGHYVGQTEAIIDAEMHHAKLRHETGSIVEGLKNNNRAYIILDREGQFIQGTLKELPKTQSILSEGIILFYKDEKKYAAKINTFPDGRKVLIGVDITSISQNYDKMRWLSWISIFLVFLVICTAYLISQFVVRGTNRIAATAKEIMETGDLSRRIDISSNWDDLGYMTGVLNDCFDRIEDLMEGISHVSDNIAHDLKTPLTRLRNHLEDLKKSAHEEENIVLEESADHLISEADHLLNTFNALLRIARIEAGKQKTKFEETDLKQVLDDTLELYEPLAEEKNISLKLDVHQADMKGDKDLLFQVFANLLDNAIKFTEPKGQVDIALKPSEENIVFSIQDNGIGVAKNEKNRIFDRFYRADKSRNTPGSGLGLSMVRAIVGLHKGSVDVEVCDPGTKFIITFNL